MPELSFINKQKDLRKCFEIKFYVILLQCLLEKKAEFDPNFFYKIFDLKKIIQDGLNDYIAQKTQDRFKNLVIKIITIIGEHLEQIIWDFNDRECIRNKHGQISRYKVKKSLNPIGAKINFETLSYLAYFSSEFNEAKISTILDSSENLNILRSDLNILLAKLEFITESEIHDLKDKQSQLMKHYSIQDEDFKNLMKTKSVDIMPEYLTDLASFSHDRVCSNNIIENINLFRSKVDSIKESNNLLHVYFLASILFQIGESLHEYSDIVKTESVRTLFGHLYKIFRTDIYFYSHKLKNGNFLTSYVNLFQEINFDLKILINCILGFLDDFGNLSQFENSLYQMIKLENIKEKTEKFLNMKKNNENKNSKEKSNLAREEIEDKKIETKLKNIVNNSEDEYLNFLNLIEVDDGSPYKLHALKFSISRIGYYFKSYNELNLNEDNFPNKHDLYSMIYDLLKTRHVNVRDVCNNKSYFLNERFELYFRTMYKNVLFDFISFYSKKNSESSRSNETDKEFENNIEIYKSDLENL
jgi:hypothetical protein